LDVKERIKVHMCSVCLYPCCRNKCVCNDSIHVLNVIVASGEQSVIQSMVIC